MELAILNGQVVTEQGVFAADVGISGGRLAQLAAPGMLPPAAETVDARGLLVLPGAIDVHFHARTPAYPERGDFFTESRAAAAGGVTTVFEMPISRPGCATPDTFRNRRRLAAEQCIVNYGLYGAPGTLIREDVLTMAAEGAVAFKVFMHRAPLGREDEFIGICLTDDDQLHAALALVKETRRRLVVHCESDALLEAGIRRLREAGRNDAAAHNESRPPVVEAVAIARLLTLAEDVGAPVHVAHVTCRAALDVVRRFQRDGVDVTAETCPHYLFFTQDDYFRLGAFAKINPPIRAQTDQDALWEGLGDGTIALVTTDHSPYRLVEKERGEADMWRTPSGAPGVQMLLPIMLTAALRGQLPLEQAVRLISGEPARLFGIADRKGALRPGLDADICLYDPAPEFVMTREHMWSKARDIDRLYDGYQFQGRVVATYVCGRTVFREGEILAPAGSGSLVRPV